MTVEPLPSAHALAAPGPSVPLRLDAIGADEELGPALRRLCVMHLDAAIDGLRQPDRDAGVHEARKAMKRVRAVIRLARDALGQWTYRQENVVLRDSARGVASVRDGAVLVETLERLIDRYEPALAPDTWQDLRSALVARHEWRVRRMMGDSDAMAGVITTLRTARRRMASWPAEAASGDPLALRDRFDEIAPGVERVYRRGRRAMELAAAGPTEVNFHSWRKRVKYLRHQMEALEGMWPAVIGATAMELDQLGEMLGEEHDLAVLAETVASDPALCSDPAQRRLLYAVAAYERRVLQTNALSLGERLYVESPPMFVTRLAGYWNAWRPAGNA